MEWNDSAVIVQPKLYPASVNIRGLHGVFHVVNEAAEVTVGITEVDQEHDVRLVRFWARGWKVVR